MLGQALRVAPRGSGRGVDPALPLGSFEIALKSDPPPGPGENASIEANQTHETSAPGPNPVLSLGGRSRASVHCSIVPEEDTPHRTVRLLPEPDTSKCY